MLTQEAVTRLQRKHCITNGKYEKYFDKQRAVIETIGSLYEQVIGIVTGDEFEDYTSKVIDVLLDFETRNYSDDSNKRRKK